MTKHSLLVAALAVCALAAWLSPGDAFAAPRWASHPPLRLHRPLNRPMVEGPAFFVDAARGDDANDGSLERPWRTVAHALTQLGAGHTLYLREGVYHEQVAVRLAGRPGAPVTIRSYPGETAVLDGGLPDFFNDPASAWAPYDGPGAAEGEYRSVRQYLNIRDVVGAFGDSMVGLQTYWHAMDLRADNELWHTPEGADDVEPVYCGPGVWYDRQTGHIHVRLAHTNLPRTVRLDYPVEVDFDTRASNYRGETDPRKVPMVLVPFDSVPLRVSGAEHVRFQDLVVRGGGYDVVQLHYAKFVEFDNVTIWSGTYAMRARSSANVRFHRSAMYGNVPPWGFRTEGSLRSYRTQDLAGRGLRDIARLNTHALLITEGDEESDVYYYPRNMDWEISYSEFTDGHDGVYLTGLRMRFHNNWLDNFNDDAMFLSTPTPFATDDVHIYQNLFTRSLMGFSLASSRVGTDGKIYIYRNVLDMRHGVNRGRPSPQNPEGAIECISPFKLRLPEIESLFIYQNTFIAPRGRFFAMTALGHLKEGAPRRVFNNLFAYLGGYPPRMPQVNTDLAQSDHNLHWSPDAEAPANYLAPLQPAWEANSLVADPLFRAFSPEEAAKNDYRISQGSPAAGAGTVLPEEWEDPLRPANGQAPDIGALPLGAAPFAVGRQAGR